MCVTTAAGCDIRVYLGLPGRWDQYYSLLRGETTSKQGAAASCSLLTLRLVGSRHLLEMMSTPSGFCTI
ncbi:hypothetical protein GDO81_024406 [Engystomops pustulosus]|uniref:Uncharacterized protein n=1 Tax=Engystomops pustulosus TaxID=76066 RepID=A0AAV6YRL1_ENGPU|nr:hypothetical protein GDO81_024406 [Engystomops pustulosus]